MTRLPFILPFTCFLLAFVPAMAAAQPPAAPESQEKKPQPTIPADGTEVLRFLLDRARIQPVETREIWRLNTFGDVIVIVLGNTRQDRFGQTPMQLAHRAIIEGGAALIASDKYLDFGLDFPNSRSVRGGNAGIPKGRVAGTTITNSRSLFRGHLDLPFVVPLPKPAGRDGPQWTLFEGLNRIATNKPGHLVVPHPRREFASLLASFPKDCVVNGWDFGNGIHDVDQRHDFFAVGNAGRDRDSHRPYRFLALADPSVFINQMMLASDEQGPVDNLEFAERTVQFLADEGGSNRKRCIFFQNGQVVERFDTLRSMMQPPLPIPNIMALQEKLVDFADAVVDKAESSDLANKLVMGKEDEQRNRNFKRLMKVVLALLVVRGVWYLLKRIWQSRRPADGPGGVPGGLPRAASGERSAGVFDRRQRELARRNNLYEPFRAAVREMFIEAGASPDPLPEARMKLPEVVIAEVVLKPETLREALSELWKIAFGPPRVIPAGRWRILEPLLARARQAHADGKWRFA